MIIMIMIMIIMIRIMMIIIIIRHAMIHASGPSQPRIGARA